MTSTTHSRRLAERANENSLRDLPKFRNGVDFTSNDYLGFAKSTQLRNHIEDLYHRYHLGNGSTGSRLLTGNSDLIEAVEKNLATLFQAETALIFNSGYTANLGVLSCLPQKNDTVIYDEYSHACIKDGARLSLAKRFSFRHNDLTDLEKKIKKATGNIFIAVESIYSMDGDFSPLQELVNLAQRHNASIILDEAHSTGVVGDSGSGIAVASKLHSKIDIRIYTFGKAMGIHGACVVGSKELIDYLINFARPFIYTTAPSPHNVVAIQAAFDYLKSEKQVQSDLFKNIDHFLAACRREMLNGKFNRSPIQSFFAPGNENAKAASSSLLKGGFDVRPILSPTVKAGTERLRIALHSFNQPAEISTLVHALSNLQAK